MICFVIILYSVNVLSHQSSRYILDLHSKTQTRNLFYLKKTVPVPTQD